IAMKKIITAGSLLILFVAFLAACQKEENEIGPALDLFKAVPANKYYATDILNGKPYDIYGNWRVVSTSGGLHGGGYASDFEYLLIKPNAVFGIVRNGELVTTGKIEVINDPNFDLLLHFVSDKPASEANVQLLYDFEKSVEIRADTLSLVSPCCDRFDTHLKKL
ncbi:MAG: hypothetical protein ACKVU2_15690, partial [Saprospiraceae bacterium]